MVTTIDLGCGNHKQKGITLDIDPKVKPHIIADVHFLPIRNGTFDKVISHEVIEHLETPKQFLLEIKRILTPHGKAELSTPNVYQLRRLFRAILGRKLVNYSLDHYHCFTKYELENLARETGFDSTSEYVTLAHHKIKHHFLPWLERLCPMRILSAYSLIVHIRKS